MAEKRKVNEMGDAQCSGTNSEKRHMEELTEKVTMNEYYCENTFKEDFSKAFTERQATEFKNGAKVITEPFTCAILPNFIHSDRYLQVLKAELLKIELEQKDCDLFKFKQSKDFKSYTNNLIINKFNEMLSENFLNWLKDVCHTPLATSVDMSCSVFNSTDVLLCHDDRLQDRKIAFIFYLVPEWGEEDGGTLDLFTSEKNSPIQICTSIMPQWNKMVFFEVSPRSFHQVSEILSDKTRISISGWVHGIVPLQMNLDVIASMKKNMNDWINPMYL